jgi:hypothetical protein
MPAAKDHLASAAALVRADSREERRAARHQQQQEAAAGRDTDGEGRPVDPAGAAAAAAAASRARGLTWYLEKESHERGPRQAPLQQAGGTAAPWDQGGRWLRVHHVRE